ncbi:hypothetical protein EPO04_03360 [Patescibacteria group bacterium]|nr:MAG: hypothetical protein EPO04_03360 [Patescibacteria group bacterium]
MAKKLAKNKKVLFLLLAVAIVAVSSAVYIKLSRPDTQPTDQQKLQEEERQAGPTDPKTDNEAYRRQQQSQTQSSSASSSATASVSISSLTQDATNVYVSGVVDGQTKGTCTARLSSGSQTITKTAPLGLVTNYYACQGFTITKTEFPAKGSWDVKIEFVNGSTTGSSPTERITLQ